MIFNEHGLCALLMLGTLGNLIIKKTTRKSIKILFKVLFKRHSKIYKGRSRPLLAYQCPKDSISSCFPWVSSKKKVFKQYVKKITIKNQLQILPFRNNAPNQVNIILDIIVSLQLYRVGCILGKQSYKNKVLLQNAFHFNLTEENQTDIRLLTSLISEQLCCQQQGGEGAFPE